MQYKGILKRTDLVTADPDDQIAIERTGTGPVVLVRRGDLVQHGIRVVGQGVAFSERHHDGVQPRTVRLNITGGFARHCDHYSCTLTVVS